MSKGRILVAALADNDAAALSPKKPCGGRAGCGSCGGCATLPDIYTGKFHIPVPNADAFRIGDRISFSRYIPEPNIVSALVFGIPLAMVMATIILWLVYAPDGAESPRALLTIGIAFSAGVAILALLDTLFKKRYPAALTNTANSKDPPQ